MLPAFLRFLACLVSLSNPFLYGFVVLHLSMMILVAGSFLLLFSSPLPLLLVFCDFPFYAIFLWQEEPLEPPVTL